MAKLLHVAVIFGLLALCAPAFAEESEAAPRHRVLIELFTSQG